MDICAKCKDICDENPSKRPWGITIPKWPRHIDASTVASTEALKSHSQGFHESLKLLKQMRNRHLEFLKMGHWNCYTIETFLFLLFYSHNQTICTQVWLSSLCMGSQHVGHSANLALFLENENPRTHGLTNTVYFWQLHTFELIWPPKPMKSPLVWCLRTAGLWIHTPKPRNERK